MAPIYPSTHCLIFSGRVKPLRLWQISLLRIHRCCPFHGAHLPVNALPSSSQDRWSPWDTWQILALRIRISMSSASTRSPSTNQHQHSKEGHDHTFSPSFDTLYLFKLNNQCCGRKRHPLGLPTCIGNVSGRHLVDKLVPLWWPWLCCIVSCQGTSCTYRLRRCQNEKKQTSTHRYHRPIVTITEIPRIDVRNNHSSLPDPFDATKWVITMGTRRSKRSRLSPLIWSSSDLY